MKIAGLGIAIWGLTLLWSEVNLMLTLPAMIGLVLAWGIVTLVHILGQRLDPQHHDGAGQGHPSHSAPAVLTR